jgi:hypothetical protein
VVFKAERKSERRRRFAAVNSPAGLQAGMQEARLFFIYFIVSSVLPIFSFHLLLRVVEGIAKKIGR